MYYQNGIVSCHTSKSLHKLRGKQGICTKCTCKKKFPYYAVIDSKSRFTDGVGYTSLYCIEWCIVEYTCQPLYIICKWVLSWTVQLQELPLCLLITG